MSQWTHVNASIRFDMTSFNEKFKPQLGEMVLWDDDDDEEMRGLPIEHFNGFIPEGSEGSLQYNIWEGTRESSAANCTVSIWGDLRNYDNVEEILEYFNKIVEGKSIRSGVLEIEVGAKFCSVFRYQIVSMSTEAVIGKFIEVYSVDKNIE